MSALGRMIAVRDQLRPTCPAPAVERYAELQRVRRSSGRSGIAWATSFPRLASPVSAVTCSMGSSVRSAAGRGTYRLFSEGLPGS